MNPVRFNLWLEELADKHDKDVNKIVVGRQYAEIVVQSFDQGASPVWETLERIKIQ